MTVDYGVCVPSSLSADIYHGTHFIDICQGERVAQRPECLAHIPEIQLELIVTATPWSSGCCPHCLSNVVMDHTCNKLPRHEQQGPFVHQVRDTHLQDGQDRRVVKCSCAVRVCMHEPRGLGRRPFRECVTRRNLQRFHQCHAIVACAYCFQVCRSRQGVYVCVRNASCVSTFRSPAWVSAVLDKCGSRYWVGSDFSGHYRWTAQICRNFEANVTRAGRYHRRLLRAIGTRE